MKKIFFAITMMLLGLTGTSAQDSNIFTHLGVGIGVGTPGIGIDLSTNVTDYVGVRAGVNIMPQFKYSTDVDIKNNTQLQQNYNDWVQAYPTLHPGGELPSATIPSKVDVEGKLKLTTGHILFDVYPGKSIDWHLTVGAYFGGSKIVNVYTKDDNQLADIAQYNTYVMGQGQQEYKIGAQLGDYFLEPDARGHIDADIKVAGFRPYVGIGYGRAVPKNHTLGFQVDLGVQFWGTPKVYCQGDELTKDNLEGNDGGFMKTLTKITVYPVLNW